MNNQQMNMNDDEYQPEPMIAEMQSINISQSQSDDSNMSDGDGGGSGDGVRRNTSMSEDEDEDVDENEESMEVEEMIAMERTTLSSVGVTSTGTGTGTGAATSASSVPLEESHELDATVVKRRAIQAVRQDPNLDEQTKRFRIQQLMDGSSYHQARAHAHAMNMNMNMNTTGAQSSSLLLRTSSSRSASDFSGVGVGVTVGMTGAGTSSSAARRSSSYGIGASHGAASSSATTTSSSSRAHADVMTCLHYEGRKCNIVAPCCGKIFGCRVCHDEMVTDGHEMNRFLVREIVCKECHTRQECSNTCIKCGITFGEYHCNICNLWMNTTKQPFHCEKCGICRVGGRENFVHCDQCDMCISRSTYNNHLCLKDKFKNSCPICFENMHTSRHAALDLPCGHAIHTHCFRKLAAFDYRCPICKKTVVNSDTMSRAWTERAREIQSQPMPADLARTVDIWCNDCEVKSEGRDWHFLGVQCPNCRSFNTAVENNVSRRGESTGGGRH